MKKLLIMGVVLICAQSFNVSANDKTRNLTNEEKEYVEKSVKAVLKDPESANFKHTKLVPSNNAVDLYCGMVNSKNSFGGYTGFSAFIVGISTNKDNKRVAVYLGPQEETDTAQQAVMKMCAKYGY